MSGQGKRENFHKAPSRWRKSLLGMQLSKRSSLLRRAQLPGGHSAREEAGGLLVAAPAHLVSRAAPSLQQRPLQSPVRLPPVLIPGAGR